MNLRGMTKGLGRVKSKAESNHGSAPVLTSRLTHAPGLFFTYAPDTAAPQPLTLTLSPLFAGRGDTLCRDARYHFQTTPYVWQPCRRMLAVCGLERLATICHSGSFVSATKSMSTTATIPMAAMAHFWYSGTISAA